MVIYSEYWYNLLINCCGFVDKDKAKIIYIIYRQIVICKGGKYMTKKIYSVYMMFIGVICIYVIVRHIFFFSNSIPFRTDVIQGILVGLGLAIFSAFITSIIM